MAQFAQGLGDVLVSTRVGGLVSECPERVCALVVVFLGALEQRQELSVPIAGGSDRSQVAERRRGVAISEKDSGYVERFGLNELVVLPAHRHDALWRLELLQQRVPEIDVVAGQLTEQVGCGSHPGVLTPHVDQLVVEAER